MGVKEGICLLVEEIFFYVIMYEIEYGLGLVGVSTYNFEKGWGWG